MMNFTSILLKDIDLNKFAVAIDTNNELRVFDLATGEFEKYAYYCREQGNIETARLVYKKRG